MSTEAEVSPVIVAAAVPRSRRGLKVLLGIVVAAGALLLVAAGGLYAWDAGYQGRVLPGVRAGTVDLSGMDRPAAVAALTAAYPYADGQLIIRGPDGDAAIPYGSFGRRANVDALVDEAMRMGRVGSVPERVVGQVRLAAAGTTLEPAVVVDETALARAIEDAVHPLAHPPVNATILMTGKHAIALTRSRTGRAVDPAPIQAAALAALGRTDAPTEVVIPVATTVVRPAVEDSVVFDARTAAITMARDLRVVFKDKSWTISAGRIRSWLHFEPAVNGTIVPVIDETKVPAVLGKAIAKAVKRSPKSAQYLVARSGKIVGVVASSTGRKLDTRATTASIVAALNERAAGLLPGPVKVRTTVLMPKLLTDEAAKTAPVMSLLGSWRTWFPISERNFNGANIWVPAKLINGTVLRPGQSFDWWDAIWPVTPARGFGPGGVIRVDHTEPTGALGGGMCSSSTTLFNAAMRAGLEMGERSNHRYYINRYPLGLDATVSIIGGGRQSMTFRNDTKHSIFIRGIRTRAGGVGWVTYEIWGIPDGRTVRVSKPSVWNVRQATTTEKPVDTLPKGQREQIEYPANGMDVSVTRVVRNAKGSVIHRDTWFTHYVRWDGIVEVGR